MVVTLTDKDGRTISVNPLYWVGAKAVTYNNKTFTRIYTMAFTFDVQESLQDVLKLWNKGLSTDADEYVDTVMLNAVDQAKKAQGIDVYINGKLMAYELLGNKFAISWEWGFQQLSPEEFYAYVRNLVILAEYFCRKVGDGGFLTNYVIKE